MRAESALSLYFTWPSRLGIGLNQNHGMFSFLQVTLYLIYIHFTINQTVCRWFRRQISNQQVKSITFLVWKFRSMILIFLVFFCRICQIHCFLHTVATIQKKWHIWIVIFASNCNSNMSKIDLNFQTKRWWILPEG